MVSKVSTVSFRRFHFGGFVLVVSGHDFVSVFQCFGFLHVPGPDRVKSSSFPMVIPRVIPLFCRYINF